MELATVLQMPSAANPCIFSLLNLHLLLMFRILLREPRMNMPRYIRRHQAAHPTPEIYDYLSRFSAVCGKKALVVLLHLTPRSAAAFSGRLERLVRCAMKYDCTESKIDHYELFISFSVFFFFLL